MVKYEEMKSLVKKIMLYIFPELHEILNGNNKFRYIRDSLIGSTISTKSRIYGPYSISNLELGDYSYIGRNSMINNAKIGRFCSIGPNLVCGYGIHPTNGITTSPMFYANNKSNGLTLCDVTKIEETKLINIGNDVWIGINVTILDGVKIGNGVVIAAGSVVTKNVPDYAIYGGVPAKLIRYRFNEGQIEKFKKIEWWNFKFEKLKEIEEMFFDVDVFLDKNIE